MAKNETTSAIIDNILRLMVGGAAISSALVLPGMAIALDKPLQKFFDVMDERSRKRELSRILRYMRTQGLIKEEYQHGLILTNKGRKRLMESQFDALAVEPIVKWDGLWKIVLYDIPESRQLARRDFAIKLRELGFYQLQRSVWLHPFPCRDVVETITVKLGVARFTTLLESTSIDNQIKLIERFKRQFPKTTFP